VKADELQGQTLKPKTETRGKGSSWVRDSKPLPLARVSGGALKAPPAGSGVANVFWGMKKAL